MKKIIVEMYRGILNAVYASSPCAIDIRMIDDDDKNDLERAEEYWRNKWLIDRKCYTGICNDQPSESKVNEGDILIPMQASNMESILETCHGGKDEMEKEVAFIDGFLAAWGYLSRLMDEMDSTDEFRVKISGRFESVYDLLCTRLWGRNTDTILKRDCE